MSIAIYLYIYTSIYLFVLHGDFACAVRTIQKVTWLPDEQREGGRGDEGSLYQRNLRKVNEVACKRGERGGGKGLAMKTVIDI